MIFALDIVCCLFMLVWVIWFSLFCDDEEESCERGVELNFDGMSVGLFCWDNFPCVDLEYLGCNFYKEMGLDKKGGSCLVCLNWCFGVSETFLKIVSLYDRRKS